MSKAKNHGALLYNMVNLKKMIFPGYNGEIYRILNKKDEVAHYADRADTLEGATPEEILAESRSLLAQHIANKNNPHQETPGSIGVLSAEYVLNQLKNKVPVGMSPFDIFGYHTKTWNKENVNNKFTISGSNVSHLRQEVIIKGVLYTIVAGSQNLSSINSSWSNKLWYVFIVLEDGIARFIYSDAYLAESLFRFYIGSIHTGTGAKSLSPVVRLDTFRLSTTPLGSGIAVGLNGFDSSEGIDLGWRPGQSTVRPERPPKVDIWIVNYAKSSDGTSGYIDTAEYAGEKLLQVNQGVVPNINFGIDGDGVTVTASINVHSGSAPTVTKVSNTQFRVSGNSYSLSTVTFTARNQYGDTESVYLHFEVRTNLTVGFGSATSAISTGTQGGLTLASYRIDTDGRVNLALTGDGVTTVLQSRTNTSGSGATVTKVNQTRYDIRGAIDNVMLLTFRATDKYGRSVTFSMYVNVRTALPPKVTSYTCSCRDNSYGGCGTWRGSNLTTSGNLPGYNSLASVNSWNAHTTTWTHTFDFDRNEYQLSTVNWSYTRGYQPSWWDWPYTFSHNVNRTQLKHHQGRWGSRTRSYWRGPEGVFTLKNMINETIILKHRVYHYIIH